MCRTPQIPGLTTLTCLDIENQLDQHRLRLHVVTQDMNTSHTPHALCTCQQGVPKSNHAEQLIGLPIVRPAQLHTFKITSAGTHW
jgi:hypothetical protein